MNDKDFLQWIHDRLVHVYGENPDFDYMHKFRSIIDNKDNDRCTNIECKIDQAQIDLEKVKEIINSEMQKYFGVVTKPQ